MESFKRQMLQYSYQYPYLRVGASVQLSGCHDIVAGLGQCQNRIEDRVGPTGNGKTRHFMSALQEGVATLQYMIGRVHQTTVDVPEFLESEQIRRMVGILENEGRSAVERNSAGSPMPHAVHSLCIRSVAAMQGDGIKALGS